jgi:hypothetical protein
MANLNRQLRVSRDSTQAQLASSWNAVRKSRADHRVGDDRLMWVIATDRGSKHGLCWMQMVLYRVSRTPHDGPLGMTASTTIRRLFRSGPQGRLGPSHQLTSRDESDLLTVLADPAAHLLTALELLRAILIARRTPLIMQREALQTVTETIELALVLLDRYDDPSDGSGEGSLSCQLARSSRLLRAHAAYGPDPLDQAGQAHECLAAGGPRGRLVLIH